MNSLGGEGAQDAPHPCWLQIASCVQIVRALARGSAYREIHVAQPSVAVRVLLARAAKSTDGACRWRHRGQHQHRGNQRRAVSAPCCATMVTRPERISGCRHDRADYAVLRDEIAERLADRLEDTLRKFPVTEILRSECPSERKVTT